MRCGKEEKTKGREQRVRHRKTDVGKCEEICQKNGNHKYNTPL